ncbi:TIGR02147 family protein [Bdellovibrio sp. SKB1291214]|uniref:TIGR02147 family protein n=1 Tax=Bdellovibrio sp. SKB1291214 TaxID=1732569 RepID=UPI0015950749|nr:TIGR02147 family protein [Bdellovibrio sp. SKB1291214]UYL07891.1 TIGR02147 family protein [Bdellovibrio sp. SKB1291214]
MSSKPQVTTFIDYRLFLRHWYDFNKSQTPSFSFGTWTRQCGFKSRSALSNILHGTRNLGNDSIPLILNSLKLNPLEAEYFEHLVLYANASNFRTKEYHFQQIIALYKQHDGEDVKDVVKFLANPKTPRVHLLLTLQPLKCTAAFVAQTFEIPRSEALEILETIKACGLATYNEASGCWSSTTNNLRIPSTMSSTAIQSFHNNALTEAQNAIMLPSTERHFESMSLTLNQIEYEELKKDVDQFLSFLSKKYTSDSLDGSRICQMNLNIIPTSQRLEVPVSTAKDNAVSPSPALENIL